MICERKPDQRREEMDQKKVQKYPKMLKKRLKVDSKTDTKLGKLSVCTYHDEMELKFHLSVKGDKGEGDPVFRRFYCLRSLRYTRDILERLCTRVGPIF